MRIPANSTYSGPLLRVRRSNDNAELDIGVAGAQVALNRNFATASDWSLGTGVTYGTNQLVLVNAGIIAGQNMGLVTGRSYQFSIIVNKTGAGPTSAMRISTGNSPTVETGPTTIIATNPPNGLNVFRAVITANGPCLVISADTNVLSGSINFVSMQETNAISGQNAWLNEYALLGHVTVNSGFVTTRYDLTGNGRHETQTTSAAQPRIVNAGVVDTAGGIPTIVFSGAQGLVTPITLSRTTYPNVLVNTVYQATNISSGTQTLWGGDNASSGFPRWQVLYFGTFPSASFSVSTGSASLVQANMNNTNRNVYSYVSNYPTASASYVAINGTQNTSFTETVGSGALALTFGAINPSLLYPFTGNIQESIVWFSAPTVAQRQALERNQGTAYGITVA